MECISNKITINADVMPDGRWDDTYLKSIQGTSNVAQTTCVLSLPKGCSHKWSRPPQKVVFVIGSWCIFNAFWNSPHIVLALNTRDPCWNKAKTAPKKPTTLTINENERKNKTNWIRIARLNVFITVSFHTRHHLTKGLHLHKREK